MVQVSVVIPTFNRSSTVLESVNSVLRQSFQDFEIIIVDDCSSDNTLDMLSDIDDGRIRIIKHERNQGAGAARNTGIRTAQGEFVAFQDSDDEWLPTKLAKQLAVLKSKGPDWPAAYCGMLIVRGINQQESARTRVWYIPDDRPTALDGDLVQPLIANSFISTQTLIVRRDALQTVGEFDESLPALEDWDFTLRIAQVGKIAFVDEPLVLQRFSANSITRSEPKRVKAYIRIFEKMKESLPLSPAVINDHNYSISGGLRRLGDLGTASRYALSCVYSSPFQLKYWASFLYIVGLILKSRLTPNQTPDE